MFNRFFFGYSLLEFVTVFAIVAILLVTAGWDFRSFFLSNKLDVAAKRLMLALQYARSEAISRRKIIGLCGSSDDKHCDGDWNKAWLAIEDGKKTPLRVFLQLSALKISWRSSFGRNEAIYFSADGFTLGQRGTFSVSGLESSSPSISIIITQSGRARIQY